MNYKNLENRVSELEKKVQECQHLYAHLQKIFSQPLRDDNGWISEQKPNKK